MSYTIEELNINNRLKELNLSIPNSLSILPENFETAESKSAFIFTDSMVDLNKLFRLKNLSFEILGGDTENYRTRKNADLYLPAFLISSSLITNDPNIISVTLNVISSFIYDLTIGGIGKKTANVELYIETEKKGETKKISYNGDAEGLKELEKIIKALK